MRISLALVGIGLAAVLPLRAEDPWLLLERFRDNLEARSPFTARFDQSYIPGGFSSGETESGRLMLSLPECMRWDYDDPYPKSFILCGDVVHFWNPGESEGHREEIDAKSQPGLDLLLLGTTELRSRYSAASGERTAERVEILLRPLESIDYVLEATLTLDVSLTHLLQLRYLDEEGNRTSFELSDYHSGLEPSAFNPPEDITWVEY